MSPDPYNGSYDLSDPQSFNRYAYTNSNPLMFTDATGLCPDNLPAGTICEDAYCHDGATASCSGGGVGWLLEAVTLGLDDLFKSLFGGPHFHGSQLPRPNGPNKPVTCADNPVNQVGGNLHQNIQVSKALSALSLFGGPFGSLASLGTYYGLVHTGGPWDFKDSPGPGTHDQRVAAGNINFGATCFIGDEACQYAAGLYGKLGGNPGTAATHFDIPSDNQQIQQGQALRKKGC
jgi:hypothetical protein